MGKIFEALEKSGQPKIDVAKNQRNLKVSAAHDLKAPDVFPSKKEPQGDLKPDPDFKDKFQNKTKHKRVVNSQTIAKPLFRKEKIDPRLTVLLSPQSFEAEQFRMLRTSILFPPSGKLVRSILVISTAPNEGKSFTAVNLALSIAQNIDKRVLLMDCDMRNPCVHTMLGYDHAMGLSDYINSDIPLSQLLLRTPSERLTILPGGTIPPNPSELLSSNRMSALLKEVKSRYSDRFIIIDSPPPQLTSEANALTQIVDGILLVVRMDSTGKNAAKELVEKIGRDRFIGTVANHVKNNSSYYGNIYYGSYSKYFSRSN